MALNSLLVLMCRRAVKKLHTHFHSHSQIKRKIKLALGSIDDNIAKQVIQWAAQRHRGRTKEAVIEDLEERAGKRNVDNGLQVQLEENGGDSTQKTELDEKEWSYTVLSCAL